MKLRKLTPAESARLCTCLALPGEHGHRRGCPHWRAQRVAYQRAYMRQQRRKKGR